jgi:hypothetical protein
MAKVKVPDIEEIAKLLGLKIPKEYEDSWYFTARNGIHIKVTYTSSGWKRKIYVSIESQPSRHRKSEKRRLYVTPDNYDGQLEDDWVPRPLTDDEKSWIKYKYSDVHRVQKVINSDRKDREKRETKAKSRMESLEAKLRKNGLDIEAAYPMSFSFGMDKIQIHNINNLSEKKVLELAADIKEVLDKHGMLVED